MLSGIRASVIVLSFIMLIGVMLKACVIMLSGAFYG